jgi:hypothetical protein
MKKFILFNLFIALIVFGCSSTPKAVKHAQQEVKVAYEIQKPVVVKTSKEDGRPEWTKRSSYSDEKNIYFTGGFLNGADFPLTLRCSNAEAIKVACQSISQFIRAEFSGYIQGSNQSGEGLDRYVNDGIATFTKALHVQGIRQTDIYYEQLFSPAVAKPAYNIWVKLEMSKLDYIHAKVEALKKLKDEFAKEGEVEAKEKAKQLLDDLKKDINL